MNKKLYIFLFLTVICGCIVYATEKSVVENTAEFMNAFKNCTEFKSVDEIEIDGVTSKVFKNIIGWDGYTCKYQEIIEFKEMNFKSKVNCSFSGEQVREIYSVMEKEALDAVKNPQKYQNMTLETAQKSPVIKVWNKYLGDSSVCKIEM